MARKGQFDGHPASHVLHLAGLALLHGGRVDEAHAVFEEAARYEEADLDVEFRRQLTQPMSEPPAAA